MWFFPHQVRMKRLKPSNRNKKKNRLFSYVRFSTVFERKSLINSFNDIKTHKNSKTFSEIYSNLVCKLKMKIVISLCSWLLSVSFLFFLKFLKRNEKKKQRNKTKFNLIAKKIDLKSIINAHHRIYKHFTENLIYLMQSFSFVLKIKLNLSFSFISFHSLSICSPFFFCFTII